MAQLDPITTTRAGVRIALRVIPRSPHTRLDGVRDGRLLLRVTAPPVDHAANDAVASALATLLDVPIRSVRIVAGIASRNKVVIVTGVPESRVRAHLGIAS